VKIRIFQTSRATECRYELSISLHNFSFSGVVARSRPEIGVVHPSKSGTSHGNYFAFTHFQVMRRYPIKLRIFPTLPALFFIEADYISESFRNRFNFMSIIAPIGSDHSHSFHCSSQRSAPTRSSGRTLSHEITHILWNATEFISSLVQSFGIA
jgi:hypothetical protein